MDKDVKAWVSKARSGDKTAFGKLVEFYRGRIFAVAYGIVGRREDAEDIAQDTFIKAYKAISALKAEEAFYGWLVRIAVNTSINYKKGAKDKQFVPIDYVAELFYQGETPEAAAERREGEAMMAKLLAELPPEHRAVLVLREIEGLAYDEIAAMLDIPLGTVKSRINHARDKLRRAVRKSEVVL